MWGLLVGCTDAVAAIGRKHAYGHDVQLAASVRFALQAACNRAHNHVVMVRCIQTFGVSHVFHTLRDTLPDTVAVNKGGAIKLEPV